MAKVICTELQKDGASGPNITLDTSKNVTCENNLQVDGNVTVTGTIPADKLTGTAAAINGSNITNLPAANLTGALPAISGASLTGISSSPPPFRNLVINGDMQVAQRGTSATTNGYGTVDRFTCQYGGQDEVLTQEQVSLTSSDTGPWAKGFRKAFKITNGNQSSGAGGDDYAQTIYHFEGQDINTSGWDFADPNSKITVSFWAKSSVAQTFNLRFRAYATAQQEYYTSFALSANTWTKVTKTIPGHANLAGIPSDNGGQFFMVFQYYYGTNLTGTQTENAWHAKDTANTYPDMTTTWWTTNDATFHLTGVQLEVADTATEFENRTYADQLQRCQRYFQVWRDVVGLIMRVHSSTQALTHVPLQSPMRHDAPTYSIGNAHQNFDLLYGGSVLASQNSSNWAFTAGGPRFGGFELMMTRGSGTFSDLNTVLHANIQFEYPDSSLPGIAQYWASADSEM